MDGAKCGTCGAASAKADSFLDSAGVLVCRRCYYAEQTKLQDLRAETSEQQIGIYDTWLLGKRVLIGGAISLIGSASLLGGIRSGSWQTSAWSLLILLLGVAVLTIALRAARQPKD